MSDARATDADAVKRIVRRVAEEIQSDGDWAVFDEIFADDFEDFTPIPGNGNDKAAVLALYQGIRTSFPDLRAEVHWQRAENNVVTTFKTYHGTHDGELMGIPPSGKKVSFNTVDAMRVVDGKINAHWGVADLLGVLQQIGALPGPPPAE